MVYPQAIEHSKYQDTNGGLMQSRSSHENPGVLDILYASIIPQFMIPGDLFVDFREFLKNCIRLLADVSEIVYIYLY